MIVCADSKRGDKSVVGNSLWISLYKCSFSDAEHQYVYGVAVNLKRLVIRQEAFFADSGSYTADVGKLDWPPDLVRPALSASREGWHATVSGAPLAGMVCGIGVNAQNPIDVNATDAQPVCVRDPRKSGASSR